MDSPKTKGSFFHIGGISKDQLKEQLETLKTLNGGMEQRLLEQQDRLMTQQQKTRTHEVEAQLLQKRIEASEGDNSRRQEEIEEMNIKIQRLHLQSTTSQLETEVLKDENKSLAEQLETSKQQVQTVRVELDSLNDINRVLRKGFLASKDVALVLKNENEGLRERQKYLESILVQVNKNPGKFTQDASVENGATLEPRYQAEPKHDVDGNEDLREKIEVLTAESNSLRKLYPELQAENIALSDIRPKTLRSLLTLKVLETTHPTEVLDEPNSTIQLDKAEGPMQLLDQLSYILPPGSTIDNLCRRLRLRECIFCTKVKFVGDFQNTPLDWLYEYPAQGSKFFPCCHKDICRQCFLIHLSINIRNGWWHELGSMRWLVCPKAGCGRPLEIRCEADLQICLERNGDQQAVEILKMYSKALVLRQGLAIIDPRPSTEALQAAAHLHKHLIDSKRMYSFFDSRFEPTTIDDNGCLPDFTSGKILHANVDRLPEKIPLFVKFFCRNSRPKTCIICSTPKYDIEYGDVDAWKTICEKFQGPWMWDVLAYPTKEIQSCDHELDVCRACTAEHITSMLVSEGNAACDRLSCPQCSRKLLHHEVIRLVDAKTIEQYEKLLLMKALANEPNFRWCLNPNGCPSGQLYRTPPKYLKKIECEECNFEMCYEDQVPWHENLSCQEWKSQRDHGDPDLAATQEYMENNAKPCPGCTRVIAKDGGCFHMTCKWCSHQYCWVCLGDYQQVRDQGQEGHKEGCYFRDNAINPMYMRGSTLEEAIEAHNS